MSLEPPSFFYLLLQDSVTSLSWEHPRERRSRSKSASRMGGWVTCELVTLWFHNVLDGGIAVFLAHVGNARDQVLNGTADTRLYTWLDDRTDALLQLSPFSSIRGSKFFVSGNTLSRV